MPKVTAVIADAAGGEEREIVARIFVCPSENAEVVRAGARYAIAAYMNVPVYAAFQEWIGRGELLTDMWAAWKAGDRKAALAAIPDEVVDDLVVHGSPADCRARIQRYFDNGVTTSSLAILPLDPELSHADAVRAARSERRLGDPRRLMPRCGGGCRLCVVRAGRLAGRELEPDLGDVAEATPAGRLVEAELERHVGCRQQRELLGGGPFCHTPIMNEGCDSRPSARRDAENGSVQAYRRQPPESDDPEADPAVLERVEQRAEAADDERRWRTRRR